jgi:phage FluMu gp28-like protein
VLFTGPAKLALASAGKQRFEDRLLRIPIDNAVRADLHSLKKETSATGAPRFVADGTGDGHADRAWACFLACQAAADMGKLTCDGYIPVPGNADDTRDADGWLGEMKNWFQSWRGK